MSEKAKDIRATKRVNKPIQAIKRLKDHFHKLGKKNKSAAADTVSPVIRKADVPNGTTDASRTTDTSRSIIAHSVESICNVEPSHETIIGRNIGPSRETIINRNVEPSRETIISRSVEPIELRVINVSSNSEPIRNADLSRNIVTPKNMNHSQNSAIIHNSTTDIQMPNTSCSTIGDISRHPDVPSVVDPFHMNDLSRDMEISRNAEMVCNIDVSGNIKETSKSGELTGKSTDITRGKSLLNVQKSPPEKTNQLQRLRASQSLLMNTDDIKAMKVELPEKIEVEKLSDGAIEQQLTSLNQRLKILIDENEKANKREEELFTIKNQILAKIDVVKKQIGEAMDHYRDIARVCHEKIEKEEILQNEVSIYQIPLQKFESKEFIYQIYISKL
uniref:TMF_TATA_bd domain-containing protein n=1 Tax=Loa loa TaxID=7209 RepID=A0A1I7W490_LOALO